MKKYLEFKDFMGFELFIDANSIVAILDAGEAREGCFIYCSGLATPFGVKISHFDLIKKLKQLSLFELEKFD